MREKRTVLNAAPIVWSRRNFRRVLVRERRGSVSGVEGEFVWVGFSSRRVEVGEDAARMAVLVGTRWVEGKLCSRRVCQRKFGGQFMIV